MRDVLVTMLGHKLPAPVEGAIEKLLLMDRFNRLYGDTPGPGAAPIARRSLDLLNIHPQVSERDLALIPKQGPVVVVANHPFGLIEGAILVSVLQAQRPDVKIMANHLLAGMPEAAPLCIFVDPFGGADASRANRKGLKNAIEWLKGGGLLAVFPAGEVSHLNLKERTVTDPQWNHSVARLIRITGATVVPMYFRGVNSPLFQLLGCLHPRVRTALLPHEFFNKQNRSIELRIGHPIAPAKIRTYQDDVGLIRYLRRRTYLLQNREAPQQFAVTHSQAQASEAIGQLLSNEVSRLPAERTLVENDDFSVLLAKADEIPNVLHEIGRLREVTFRKVGEGTGRPIDLDRFDDHYWHLFAWHRHAREVVGAYRLGPSEEILRRFGPTGFYTSELFQWKQPFLDRICPGLELGRSFVRPEYQKTYAPLLLLWKGIGQFLVRNPRYKLLFGPVSISNGYSAASRHLMVKFLSAYRQSPEFAPLVRARNPFRQRPSKLEDELVDANACDIEELSVLVADLETDRKGVPVLLKQYLKLGGELAAFHVDRRFANALDGLIVVDLRKTDIRVLERYMGKDGAAQFLSN